MLATVAVWFGGSGFAKRLLATPGELAYEQYLRDFPKGELGKNWTILEKTPLNISSGACWMDYPGYLTLDKINSDDDLIFRYTPSEYGKMVGECTSNQVPPIHRTTEWFRGFIAHHGATPG